MDRELLAFRSLENFLQQFSNHFVTDRGDADLLPGSQQFADHSGARVGLSRAWRPLYGQDVVIQLRHEIPRHRPDLHRADLPGQPEEIDVTRQGIARCARAIPVGPAPVGIGHDPHPVHPGARLDPRHNSPVEAGIERALQHDGSQDTTWSALTHLVSAGHDAD